MCTHTPVGHFLLVVPYFVGKYIISIPRYFGAFLLEIELKDVPEMMRKGCYTFLAKFQ